jgi:hypothetical protein
MFTPEPLIGISKHDTLPTCVFDIIRVSAPCLLRKTPGVTVHEQEIHSRLRLFIIPYLQCVLSPERVGLQLVNGNFLFLDVCTVVGWR